MKIKSISQVSLILKPIRRFSWLQQEPLAGFWYELLKLKQNKCNKVEPHGSSIEIFFLKGLLFSSVSIIWNLEQTAFPWTQKQK